MSKSKKTTRTGESLPDKDFYKGKKVKRPKKDFGFSEDRWAGGHRGYGRKDGADVRSKEFKKELQRKRNEMNEGQ